MKVIDFGTNKEKVNIQIKLSPQRYGENYSKSLTVYGMSVDEVFNRIHFMLDRLSKTDSEVEIKHIKKQEDKNE